MKRAVIAFLLCAAAMAGFSDGLKAQLATPPALAASAASSGFYVRMAVHFGDVFAIPDNIVCCRNLNPGETAINVPIWVYNLHEGIDYVEFSIESNESLGEFIPNNSFAVISRDLTVTPETYRLDLVLEAPAGVCGPAKVGGIEIVRVADSNPVWIDLGPNASTGRMAARDASGRIREIVSPQRGGYVGEAYPLACVIPAIPEPNRASTEVEIAPATDCRVRARWRAGEGNRTMLRWSAERYPASIDDGMLAAEIATNPGQGYEIYHSKVPTLGFVYYTAFSITRDASGAIIRDSFAECAAAGFTYMRCPVASEESSWGAIKSLYR